MNPLQEIMLLWQNDAQFRAEFKKNPENALKNAQIDLQEIDLNRVKQMFDDSDHLDDRISK